MKKCILLICMFLVSVVSLAQYRVSTVGESKIFVMTNLDNDKEESYQREYIKADVNQLGNIVVTTAMGAGDGRPFAFSRTTGIPYTEFRDGNDSDATFANAAAVITWFRDNTGFKSAGGSASSTADLMSTRNTGGSQAIANTTWTKVTLFGSPIVDTMGGYLSGTYTPTKEGYYLVSGIATYSSVSDGAKAITAVYKNGSLYALLGRGASGSVATVGFGGSAVVPMNGTTDYVEIYTYHTSGVDADLSSIVGYQLFSAVLIK